MKIFLIAIIVAILASVVIYYFCEGLGKLKDGEKQFKIPGLAEGFTPQGLSFSKALDCFLLSGYMKNKNLASRIYVLQKNEEEAKFVTLTFDGKDFCGHCGGITCFGENVWIASDGKVLRIKASSLKNAKSGQKIEILDSFSTKNGADFCWTHSGYLWVGEFYRLGKFKTDISHHIKIDREQFHSMCYCYKISPNAKFGVESVTPVKAMAVPDMAQGICVCADRLVLSASYGLAKSSLSVYKNILSKTGERTTYFGDKKIPLIILSREHLLKKYSLPSMSEEVDESGGMLFIAFESAAKKYRIFTRKKLKNIFGINVNKL